MPQFAGTVGTSAILWSTRLMSFLGDAFYELFTGVRTSR